MSAKKQRRHGDQRRDALDQREGATITPRYLLKIAKARLVELDALFGDDRTSEAYMLRRLEIADLDQRGRELHDLDTRPLDAQALKQDAWLSIAHTLATGGSARTRLMAAKMVTERSDPVPHDDGTEGVKTVVNVTIIREARALPATNGHQPRAALPAGGVVIHRESGPGPGA